MSQCQYRCYMYLPQPFSSASLRATVSSPISKEIQNKLLMKDKNESFILLSRAYA